jgi:hypothetical protein
MEHIRISSNAATRPTPHSRDTELGLSLNMSFSNEFVRGEEVVSKSESFRHLTTGLLEMLQREFVSWRGRDSFDNAVVNRRVHGDRFQRKAAARGKGR